MDWLFGNSGIATGSNARAMSEDELRVRDVQMAWACTNAKPSWAGMENYRPPAIPLPPLPDGWAEWFEFGDLLQ